MLLYVSSLTYILNTINFKLLIDQIVHKLRMREIGDEIHHSGWNTCSSCHNVPRERNTLVLPSLMSDRIYFIDTSDERNPKIKKAKHFSDSTYFQRKYSV